MDKAPVKLRLAVPYNNRLRGLPNQNFITLLESLWATEDPQISIVSLPEEALIESDDYDAVFTTRDVGAQEEHLEWYKKRSIYLLAWHDDLHRYRWARDEKVRLLFRKFEYADLIFCPYTRTLYGDKVYRPFLHKAITLSWSIADWVLDIDTEWNKRKDKVLLSGMISRQYPFRKKINRYANQNKKLFDVLEHPTYRSGHLEHSIIGKEYYRFLSGYKGGIVTTARKPINYTVAKYIEVPACGCISFMETTPDLSDMGYIDGENYISINRWNFRRKIRILLSDEAKQISISGKELIRNYHTHAIRIRTIFKELKKLVGIEK